MRENGPEESHRRELRPELREQRVPRYAKDRRAQYLLFIAAAASVFVGGGYLLSRSDGRSIGVFVDGLNNRVEVIEFHRPFAALSLGLTKIDGQIFECMKSADEGGLPVYLISKLTLQDGRLTTQEVKRYSLDGQIIGCTGWKSRRNAHLITMYNVNKKELLRLSLKTSQATVVHETQQQKSSNLVHDYELMVNKRKRQKEVESNCLVHLGASKILRLLDGATAVEYSIVNGSQWEISRYETYEKADTSLPIDLQGIVTHGCTLVDGRYLFAVVAANQILKIDLNLKKVVNVFDFNHHLPPTADIDQIVERAPHTFLLTTYIGKVLYLAHLQ